MGKDLELFLYEFPRFVPVRHSGGIHSMVIQFVCLERDSNRPTWQKLLLERVVFGACGGVGSSMLGDPNQERQWIGCIRGASGRWDARFGHYCRETIFGQWNSIERSGKKAGWQ